MTRKDIQKNPEVLFLLPEFQDEPNVADNNITMDDLRELSKNYLVVYIPDDMGKELGEKKVAEIKGIFKRGTP